MLLDGVSLDDRVVHQLTAMLDPPVERKLRQALFFSAEVVSLTGEERLAVLAALDRAPWGTFDDLREQFLASDRWAETARGLPSR